MASFAATSSTAYSYMYFTIRISSAAHSPECAAPHSASTPSAQLLRKATDSPGGNRFSSLPLVHSAVPEQIISNILDLIDPAPL